jgi:hypothetical protein
VSVSSPSVYFESPSFSPFIERTSTEAAEQSPPKSGSAQEAGATNDQKQVAWRTPIDDQSWRLRVRGADGSRATSIRAGGEAPDTRDLFVKPGSERPFYTTVHR